MVRVCHICGDAGFEELLYICRGCNVAVEHRYCMATPGVQAIIRWRCKACEEEEKIPKRAEKPPTGRQSNKTPRAPKLEAFRRDRKGLPAAEGGGVLKEQVTNKQGTPPVAPKVFWRGEIRVPTGFGVFTYGLRAHLSHLVPAVDQLPFSGSSSLNVQPLKRKNHWPRRFTKVAPSEKDVFCYFLPSSSPRDYTYLLNKMSSLDMILRYTSGSKHLFIALSRHLVERTKNSSKYLWGFLQDVSPDQGTETG